LHLELGALAAQARRRSSPGARSAPRRARSIATWTGTPVVAQPHRLAQDDLDVALVVAAVARSPGAGLGKP
jgi:hypothetical protein